MPKVKKTIRSPKVAFGEGYCRKCEQTLKITKFYEATNPILDSNGRMSVCKECCATIYEMYFGLYNNLEIALKLTCQDLDVRFSQDALVQCRSHIEKLLSQGKKADAVFGYYKSKLGSIGKNNERLDSFRFKDSDDLNYNVEQEFIEEGIEDEGLFLFWGKGFSFDDYTFLEVELSNWKQTHKCDNQAEVTLLKEICIKILTIRNKRAEKKDVAQDVKELQELFKTASVDPAKANVASAGKSQDAWGVWVKDIEQLRPAEWHDQQEKYKDMDGFVPYIKDYIVRPIKNFITGQRDFQIKDNINVNLDEEDGDLSNGRSYAKYENDFKKYSGHSNQFKAPKSMIREKDFTEQKKENIIDWNTYYRRNIHRFIQHYFGVQLYWYQIIWIYFMSISEAFVTIACRAAAKSWLIALFALARACLWANSEVVVVASTQKQAGIILGKIARFRLEHPNIAREIADFANTNNNRVCTLHNGSTIKVVACNEGGRGERSTFTIAEEFRIMDKEKYDSIVKPFAYARQTPYLKNPEYSHLIEEPREILISSAYHKALWWYQETVKMIKMMVMGKDVGFIAFDYPVAIKHGIKTRKQLIREKSTMDEITFGEEYENIPFGENSNSYFKLHMFNKNKTVKKAFYPLRKDLYDKKKNPYDIKKTDGEIRLVSVDIATRKGEKNDNTIITCIRLLPTAKGYHREFVYLESHQGEHTALQSLRIKQLYYDFDGDYIVLDLQNAGITIFERLAEITKDEERGIEYDAFTVYEHKSLSNSLIEELKEKTLGKNAKPVIYPILAYRKENSAIAVDFRDKLQRGMCSFLVGESEAEVYLNSIIKEYAGSDDIELNNWFIFPYLQTELLINETVILEYTMSNGDVVLTTIGSARKDRYTSCSYGNFFASLLELELLRKDDDDFDFIFSYS